MVFLAAFALTSKSAQAQDSNAQQDDHWTFQFAPYLWGAGQSGTVQVGNLRSAEVNAHFSDILNNLKIGVMAAFDAHRGRWSILADGFYVKVGTTSDPLLGGRLGTARLGGETSILQVAGAYRVADDSKFSFDLLAGLRYTNMLSKLDLSRSALLPSGARFSSRYTWTDGIYGFRALYYLDPAWTFTGYADVGTGGTKLSWQALIGLKYNMSSATDFTFGFRALSQDYSSGGFHYDVRTAGPYFGVAFRF